MTTPNVEMAYAILDQIDAHPELWDQSFWFTVTECGTARCFAGWACLLTGDRPTTVYLGLTPADLGVGDQLYTVRMADGEIVQARTRAQELLGITDAQAYALFDEFNDREVLGRLVAEIFGPRPEVAS